jgi:hypothetical protein
MVPPLRRLTFGKRPKSKQKVLPLASGPTASGALAPSLLQGPAAKGRPWPIAALAASRPLNPLRNDSARPADGAFVLARADWFDGVASWLLICRMGGAGRYPCGWVMAWLMGIAALNPSYDYKPVGAAHGRDVLLCFCPSLCHQQIAQTTRSPNPVRRPSGGAVERGVWHGCQTRNDGPGMAHRDDPRNSTGARGVERSETRMPGALSLWLLSLCARKEKVTRRKGEKVKYGYR